MEKIIGIDGKVLTPYGNYEILTIRQMTKEEKENLPDFEWSQDGMPGNKLIPDDAKR